MPVPTPVPTPVPNPRADACADDCTDVRAYARADAPRADDCDCADARDDPYADPYADPSRRRFSPHRYGRAHGRRRTWATAMSRTRSRFFSALVFPVVSFFSALVSFFSAWFGFLLRDAPPGAPPVIHHAYEYYGWWLAA